MKLKWVDMTDYSGMPEPAKDQPKPRPNRWTLDVGPLQISVTRLCPEFPGEWAYEVLPFFPGYYVPLRLTAWAAEEQAQERALIRVREMLEACLARLPQ